MSSKTIRIPLDDFRCMVRDTGANAKKKIRLKPNTILGLMKIIRKEKRPLIGLLA